MGVQLMYFPDFGSELIKNSRNHPDDAMKDCDAVVTYRCSFDYFMLCYYALLCVVGINLRSNMRSPGCGLMRRKHKEWDATHYQPLFWRDSEQISVFISSRVGMVVINM